MKYAAFAIDNVQDPLICTQFKGWWLTMPFKGNLVQCVGKYGDTVEYSFICLTEDFEQLANWGGWVNNQESVLLFSENNNQAAVLRYLADGRTEVLGHLRYVDKHTALRNPNGWTYRPDLNKYWIIEVTKDEERRQAAHEAWLWSIVSGNPELSRKLEAAFGFGQPAPRKNIIVPTDDTGTAFTISNLGEQYATYH